MKKFLPVVVLLLFAPLLYGQKTGDTLQYYFPFLQLNTLSTALTKQLNTYNLVNSLNINGSSGTFFYRAAERYNSTLVQSTGSNSIRDEHYLSLAGGYIFNSSFKAGISADNSILSDNRQIEINQASISNAALFLQNNSFPDITLIPFYGYTNNRQTGIVDNGALYGFEGIYNKNFEEMNIFSEMKFRNEDISPRKNYNRYINLILYNNFGEGFGNNVNFIFSRFRKDFYYEADSLTAKEYNVVNNIQSRVETGYTVEERFSYGSSVPGLSLDVLGRAVYRNIERDTRYHLQALNSSLNYDNTIDELRLELESAVGYTSSVFNGLIRLNYSERDEKHYVENFEAASTIFYADNSALESMKNNVSGRIILSLSGSFALSGTDNLYFSAYQSKLRYDTPSSENFDDRDELLSTFRIRYSKKLTPFYELFVNAEGSFNHVVYLFSESSSNNNFNRVVRLSSGGNYKGKNVSSVNIFEVSANYTVYDFEDLNPTYQSYSFRQFSAVDSTTIKLGNRFALVHYGYIKLSEQGDLKWKAFSTKPSRYLEEIYTEPKLSFFVGPSTISAGMRLFSLKTFTYSGRNKVPESRYVSTGPAAEVLINMRDSLYLKIYGWYEFIRVNGAPGRKETALNMQLNWNF